MGQVEGQVEVADDAAYDDDAAAAEQLDWPEQTQSVEKRKKKTQWSQEWWRGQQGKKQQLGMGREVDRHREDY